MRKFWMTLAPLAVAGLLVTAAARSATVPGPRAVADADAAGLYGGGCLNVYVLGCSGSGRNCQFTKGNQLKDANPKGSTAGDPTYCSSDGSTLCGATYKSPVACVTPKKTTTSN